jgi:outer membrane usher protein FimD/PapC
VTGAAVAFTMPATPGTYNVRFFLNDSWTKLATSVTITVASVVPSITLSATTVVPGGTVTATIANGPGTAGDWVGLHGASAADAAYVDWKYLSGTQTRPGSGVTGAAVAFTVPATPGTYNVRFFLNDSWQKVATSATITVQ